MDRCPLLSSRRIPLSAEHSIPQHQSASETSMPAFNIVFTVFSGIGFTLSVIPLWWHVQSWDMHVGTCMYMIWTALGCLVHFVDSIVWNGNAVNWAPVWCDICTFRYPFHLNTVSHKPCSASRIQVGVAVAWPACGLCITRRLYCITVTTTPVQVRVWITYDFRGGSRTPPLTETP